MVVILKYTYYFFQHSECYTHYPMLQISVYAAKKLFKHTNSSLTGIERTFFDFFFPPSAKAILAQTYASSEPLQQGSLQIYIHEKL